MVHQNGTPIWRPHTQLYKGARNVSANNSETVSHKDLRRGQIVYILVFYNIHFLGFFLCCVTVKTIYSVYKVNAPYAGLKRLKASFVFDFAGCAMYTIYMVHSTSNVFP